MSETIMEGTVTNDHTFTHASDAAYESISAGFFAQQDHRWIIPVSGGIGRLFHMEAFRTSSSETFTASYSLDNSNFTDMFEVTAIGTDPNSYQTFVLPDGIEGNVYIRLQDTPAGFPSVSVRVDHMFIRTSGCPTPTPSPSPTCLVHFPLATPYPALTPPATPSVVVDVPGWGGATLQPAGTIQSAVQAALTGDRISLTGSSYTETVTVTNKMLWIEDTADPPATWTGITLPSAELVAGDGRPALIIGQGGVVILKNLNLFGGNSAAHWPGFLELFGSWGGDAGPAIEVQDGGIVYLVDSQAQGGNGDSGSHHDHLTCSAPTGYEGGNGGAGINIVSGQAYADLQGLLTGGAAGYGWAGMELIGQSCCIPPAANGFPSVPLDPAESTNFKWSGFNFTNSLDSLLLAQSIPSQAGSGLESVFFITLQNTGDVTWRIGANHMLSVISDSCDMFTPAAIALPGGADVPPGGTAIFTSVITGASAPASCDLLFQMTHNGTPFGAIAGATIDVQTANNDALFPGDTIPSSMAPNQGAWIGLTAKNTGNTQWPTDGSYMLTVLDDPCGLIPLPNVVPTDYINPNMQHQFLIHLTAPGTTSPCALQLQMEEVLPDPIRTTSGPGLFGEVFSTTVQIEEPPNVVHDWRVYE